jgi:hypothetical protein
LDGQRALADLNLTCVHNEPRWGHVPRRAVG